MPQTLESMRRRIESAEDLYAVVRVMRALAAANIRQCERAVESLAEYGRAIEAGLQIVLRNQPKNLIPRPRSLGRRWGFIVFGSDQGMCGSFNEQTATFALERINELAAVEDRLVFGVGARLVGRLEDAGCAVDGRFSPPSTVSGVTAAVHAALLKVEEARFRKGIDQFLLIHHRPIAPAGSWPKAVRLLPVDPDWLESLAARSWDSRSEPMYSMDRRQLFSDLIRQHLFVVLYRAFAESLASENAGRLASTHAAERNIQNHLSRLTMSFHQRRQQAITEELLDIVAGFETLTEEGG